MALKMLAILLALPAILPNLEDFINNARLELEGAMFNDKRPRLRRPLWWTLAVSLVWIAQLIGIGLAIGGYNAKLAQAGDVSGAPTTLVIVGVVLCIGALVAWCVLQDEKLGIRLAERAAANERRAAT